MKLPPLWKVRRELDRICTAAWRGLRGALIEPPRQWLYDSTSAHKEHRVTGQQELGTRVAVFVVFQRDGLAKSLLLTMDHLAAEGWSVVVVSNGPLSDTDTALITQKAAMLLIRPNVGYDFGGYRAGLRLLQDCGHTPERLILMNDSVWFPLREGDDCLRRMEASGAAMAGHIFKTENKKGHDHLESHLLMLSSDALTHPAWKQFWDRFVMSDDRVTTIWRGEKGLSQALISAGLDVRGLMTRETLLQGLRALSDPDLRDVMAQVVHHRDDAQRHCAAISHGDGWRAAFLDWVEESLRNSRQHLISVTFVAPAMQLCGMGFVKKTSDRRFHLAREKVLGLAAQGHIAPMHPQVQLEILGAVDAQRHKTA